MLFAVWDLETTDLLKPDAKIIEFHAALWDLDTRTKVEEFHTYIDPKRSIAPSAERVHGISLASLAGKPVFRDVMGPIQAIFGRAMFRVAHNGDGFDVPFLDMELRNAGVPECDVPNFDTMLLGRWAKPDGSVPNLGALAFACDVPYDTSKAHAADYDDEVLAQCFFRGLDFGFFTLAGIVEGHAAAA